MSALTAIDVAYHALAQHILDHELPAPFMQLTPSETAGTLQVHVTNPDHLTLWLDSVIVDDEHIETRRDHDHVVYQTRLPDLGVRVAIRTVTAPTPAPRRLRTVPA